MSYDPRWQGAAASSQAMEIEFDTDASRHRDSRQTPTARGSGSANMIPYEELADEIFRRTSKTNLLKRVCGNGFQHLQFWDRTSFFRKSIHRKQAIWKTPCWESSQCVHLDVQPYWMFAIVFLCGAELRVVANLWRATGPCSRMLQDRAHHHRLLQAWGSGFQAVPSPFVVVTRPHGFLNSPLIEIIHS